MDKVQKLSSNEYYDIVVVVVTYCN
jgi:hypothetical protein